MRVIAGTYRGRKLKTPPSLETRPTSDRLRETLFNILAPHIEGARFLDLCAGTGAVGIEALSRGAAHATFVDQSRKMCGLIEANLQSLGIRAEDFDLITAEASGFLRRNPKKQSSPFDLVFFDPPYAADYEAVLDLIAEGASDLLSEAAVMVVEHYKKKDLPESFRGLRRDRIVKQGDSMLSFYRVP